MAVSSATNVVKDEVANPDLDLVVADVPKKLPEERGFGPRTFGF